MPKFRSQDDLEKVTQLLFLAGYKKIELELEEMASSPVYPFQRELEYEGDLALLQQTEKTFIWDLLARNDIEPVGYPNIDVGEVR